MRFRIEGDDLNAAYRQLRDTDKKLASALRKGLRNSAQPVVDAVKAEAEAQGLHKAAAATRARFSSTARRGLTVTVATDHKAAPMARPLEGGSAGRRGQVNRHPVFGHDVWVNQPLRPYFWKGVTKASPEVGRRVKAALDAVFTR